MRLRKTCGIVIILCLFICLIAITEGCNARAEHKSAATPDDGQVFINAVNEIPRDIWLEIINSHIMETNETTALDLSRMKSANYMVDDYNIAIYCYRIESGYYLYFRGHFNDDYITEVDSFSISESTVDNSVVFLERKAFPEALSIIKECIN